MIIDRYKKSVSFGICQNWRIFISSEISSYEIKMHRVERTAAEVNYVVKTTRRRRRIQLAGFYACVARGDEICLADTARAQSGYSGIY